MTHPMNRRHGLVRELRPAVVALEARNAVSTLAGTSIVAPIATKAVVPREPGPHVSHRVPAGARTIAASTRAAGPVASNKAMARFSIALHHILASRAGSTRPIVVKASGVAASTSIITLP